MLENAPIQKDIILSAIGLSIQLVLNGMEVGMQSPGIFVNLCTDPWYSQEPNLKPLQYLSHPSQIGNSKCRYP